jgi:hypothetical protein
MIHGIRFRASPPLAGELPSTLSSPYNSLSFRGLEGFGPVTGECATVKRFSGALRCTIEIGRNLVRPPE